MKASPKASIDKTNYLVAVSKSKRGRVRITRIGKFNAANDLVSLRYLVHYLVNKHSEEDLRDRQWVQKFNKEDGKSSGDSLEAIRDEAGLSDLAGSGGGERALNRKRSDRALVSEEDRGDEVRDIEIPDWKQTFLAKVDVWNIPDKVLRYRKKIKKETGVMWITKTPDSKMLLK